MMHPAFRMIVLANRPGFPFLGNDFFGALGTTNDKHAAMKILMNTLLPFEILISVLCIVQVI